MRRTKHFAAVLLLAALAGVTMAQGAPDLAALLRDLRSADAETRMATVERISEVGAVAVAPLFDMIASDDRTAGLAARLALERMVHRAAAPGSSMDRDAVSLALAHQALASRAVGVRAFAVRMLSFIGSGEAVPALARLLNHPEVAEISRWALERIPGRAATHALLAALPDASGDLKIGIINALGARGDAAALPALEAAANSDDEGARAAALAAIGRIGGPGTVAFLRKRAGESADSAVWNAYLRAAEGLVRSGSGMLAEQHCRWIYENAPTQTLRCAGIIGLGRMATRPAVRTILEALGGRDAVLRGAAAEALLAAPREEYVADLIGERIAQSAPEQKVLLLWVLGERGDAAGANAVALASRDGDERVRLAATRALGRVGNERLLGAFLERLEDESAAVREAAVEALVHADGEQFSQALASGMFPESARGGTAPVRIPERLRPTVLRVLGQRRDRIALAALCDALDQPAKEVRLAALEGLAAAMVTDATVRNRLVEMLGASDDEERTAAEHALARVPASLILPAERQGMIQAASGAPAAVRAALLRVAAGWRDPALLAKFLDAARDQDEEVAAAAVGGIGGLLERRLVSEQEAREGEIETLLRNAVEGASPGRKSAALRGYLALADMRRESDAAAALEMYHRALRAAPDDNNRRAALRGIAAIGDVKSLPLVEPLLDNMALAADAAAAAMPIADRLAQSGDADGAIRLYRKIARVSSERDRVRAAVARLRQLGVELDIAAEAGFVTRWWVLGPFAGRKQMTTRDVIPTDGPIDLAAPVVVEGNTYQWKPAQVSDPQGMLDLREAVAPQDDVAAYAYAEVISDAARDVIFKLGSDDAVFCWLNGERIHAHDVDRGYAPDQDMVRARLRAGMNFILLKVLNGGADWGFGLRIADAASNMPLHLPQRRP